MLTEEQNAAGWAAARLRFAKGRTRHDMVRGYPLVLSLSWSRQVLIAEAMFVGDCATAL